jgi:hypothetical protein
MLQKDFYAAAARSMVQLAQVLVALAGAGVPALVVKGAAAGTFYPDPALRYLDVLVPQAQVDRAEAALNGLGYHAVKAREWAVDHHHHLPPLVRACAQITSRTCTASF